MKTVFLSVEYHITQGEFSGHGKMVVGENEYVFSFWHFPTVKVTNIHWEYRKPTSYFRVKLKQVVLNKCLEIAVKRNKKHERIN